MQPDLDEQTALGIVHGGLYTAAAETFATMGAYEVVPARRATRNSVGTRPAL
jgi:acyl-coenzyme A thioesterase PaaI-like protein